MEAKISNIDWSRTDDLTVEEVKATPGLSHFTDEQAKEFIELVKIYCMGIFAIHRREVDGEIDLDEVIRPPESDNQYKNAA